jgi:hypothetical protein
VPSLAGATSKGRLPAGTGYSVSLGSTSGPGPASRASVDQAPARTRWTSRALIPERGAITSISPGAGAMPNAAATLGP